MATRYKLKERYEVESKFGAFFTGSEIAWSKDGNYLLCQNEKEVSLLDLEQGQVTGTLGGDSVDDVEIEDVVDTSEDAVTAFTESATGDYIYTSHKCRLFRKWKRDDRTLLKSWKSFHKGPIVKLAVSAEGRWMASGGTDSCVRLWDLGTYNCVHTLRGCQGVISVLKFRPYKSEVFAAGDDYAIRCWEIGKKEPRLTLSSHFSTVTALVFHAISNQLISCARDSVVCIWNIVSGELVRTVPVFESLETMVLLPSTCTLPDNVQLTAKSGIHVATAGERGVVRIWQIDIAKEVYVQTNSQVSASAEPGGLSIINLMLNETQNTLAVVSVDHNIIFHRLDTFECDKLMVGFCDEILDLAFLGMEESHLAVASNSPDLKLFRIKDMHCQLLRGHKSHVLALAVSKASPNLLSSVAKDNTVRVWSLDPESEKVTCIAVGDRHTAHVGAVSMTQLSADWLLTAAQDQCLKLWKLPKVTDTEVTVDLIPEYTEKSHLNDINCVCISPNDKLIVSASQDKTAKLWSLEGLKLLGTLEGHRRGVWWARFSPTDQVVATSSADATIKLWSIADLSCLLSLEGHDASVLRLEFLSSGLQILSAGADGLVKLWTLKSSECTATFDAHDKRIWAMTVGSNEKRLVTGGADSTIVIWKDTTVEHREAEIKAQQEKVIEEQKLSNLMQAEEYDEALQLALKLNRPKNALKAVESIISKGRDIGLAILRLSPENQHVLLKFALNWNMNTRTYQAAVDVLYSIVYEGDVELTPEEKMQAMVYAEKHYRRVSHLAIDLHYGHYLLEHMSLASAARTTT